MPVDSKAALEGPAARPLFITTNRRPLFGWHHAPLPHVRRSAAIVLCPALGYEYMSAYRTWRILAERLAALGFDTLRVDYDGTGNSAGGVRDPDRVDAWLRSIACATAEARSLVGAGPVALVGLRAGALLALQAAALDGAVERLVLWGPFASGRAYVRELKALARLSAQDDSRNDAHETEINAEGHIVSGDTVAALARWTLGAVATRPASDVLVVERDDRPADAAVEEHLTTLGCRVTRIRTEGTAEMLLPPHLAKVPEQTLDEIAAWFRGWHVSPAPHAAPPDARQYGESAVAIHDDCQERAVRFGPGDRLFGIFACPADRSSAKPTIILLSTGAGHHVGPHRLAVPLAREWAARGHHVLRFDLGGIGDSAPPAAAEGNVVYPDHMIDDAREAIAFVRREAPDRKVIAAGLCSGGWLAFQAARQDLAVDAIVAINAPLYLRDGDAQWLSEGRAIERYQQSMRDPAKWLKALRGRASTVAFTRLAANALARRVAVRVNGVLGNTLTDGLGRDLRAIADRQIRSLLVFSRGDSGYAYFQQHAPPALRRRGVRDFIQHVVVDDAGHAFRPSAAQQTLCRLLTDFVAAQTVDPVRGVRADTRSGIPQNLSPSNP
jgi:alpha-beta hydrolase superfamily lysophospholipase